MSTRKCTWIRSRKRFVTKPSAIIIISIQTVHCSVPSAIRMRQS